MHVLDAVALGDFPALVSGSDVGHRICTPYPAHLRPAEKHALQSKKSSDRDLRRQGRVKAHVASGRHNEPVVCDTYGKIHRNYLVEKAAMSRV